MIIVSSVIGTLEGAIYLRDLPLITGKNVERIQRRKEYVIEKQKDFGLYFREEPRLILGVRKFRDVYLRERLENLEKSFILHFNSFLLSNNNL